MNNNSDNRIMKFLKKGVAEGVYPGAVLLIARGDEIIFLRESGHLSLIAEQTPMRKNTIFDLASLTKPLATTLAIMKLVDQGKFGLDQPLSDMITTYPLKDKGKLTLRQILSHSAGFVDWKPFYLELVGQIPEKRKGLLREYIVEEPLLYRPGDKSIYSDLGFMILEWVIEEISGSHLNSFLELNFFKDLLLRRTFLNTGSLPQGLNKGEVAATEDCTWRKRIIQGEVHDENAYVLGGYSGHSGLFGVAEEVFIIVNMLRGHYLEERYDYLKPETVREFFKRQNVVKDSSWALGWDTPSPQNSSSGRYFSSNSVGHLGFSGTSLWMDLDRNILIVFLTNRVHPTRNNQKIKAFRPAIHDLVMEEIMNQVA
ncbi:serine hydrolase [Deltaproteobacteria bacterium]|nr:serine hydrolase [Deltaproteobacteria bacterium]